MPSCRIQFIDPIAALLTLAQLQQTPLAVAPGDIHTGHITQFKGADGEAKPTHHPVDMRLIFKPLIAGNQCGRKNRNVLRIDQVCNAKALIF